MIKHLQHELARPRLTLQLHQMLLFTKSTLDTQPCDDDGDGGILVVFVVLVVVMVVIR